jgi:hypothetical protein
MSDKSIEELLKLVSENKPSAPSKRVTGNNKTVLKFIQDLNIESGTVKVPNFVIFYYYRRIWNSAMDQQRYKTSKHAFFVTFGKHFVQHRQANQRYYLIKEGIFDLSEEAQKKADEYDRNHWAKAKKKAQEEV